MYLDNNSRTMEARRVVFDYATARLYESPRNPHPTFSLDEVYVVWFSYILGNWKALVSTSLPDGRYYEVTFRQDPALVYLDVYQKMDNIVLKRTYSDAALIPRYTPSDETSEMDQSDQRFLTSTSQHRAPSERRVNPDMSWKDETNDLETPQIKE